MHVKLKSDQFWRVAVEFDAVTELRWDGGLQGRFRHCCAFLAGHAATSWRGAGRMRGTLWYW